MFSDLDKPAALVLPTAKYELREIKLAKVHIDYKWHQLIGDPTIAYAILDRLVHSAHRINLCGATMRKLKNTIDVKVTAN